MSETKTIYYNFPRGIGKTTWCIRQIEELSKQGKKCLMVVENLERKKHALDLAEKPELIKDKIITTEVIKWVKTIIGF